VRSHVGKHHAIDKESHRRSNLALAMQDVPHPLVLLMKHFGIDQDKLRYPHGGPNIPNAVDIPEHTRNKKPPTDSEGNELTGNAMLWAIVDRMSATRRGKRDRKYTDPDSAQDLIQLVQEYFLE